MTASFWQSLMSSPQAGQTWWQRGRKCFRQCTTWLPVQAIRLYQKTVSPDHSVLGKKLYPYGYCKFHPSCSMYMSESLQKYGLIFGGLKGTARLFRCNPWHQGGIDLP